MLTKAEKEKQFAAAINAEYRSGQLAGAYVDRKEVTVSGLEGMSREQLEKKPPSRNYQRTKSMASMPKRLS